MAAPCNDPDCPGWQPVAGFTQEQLDRLGATEVFVHLNHEQEPK